MGQEGYLPLYRVFIKDKWHPVTYQSMSERVAV